MPFDGAQLDDVTKLLLRGRERIERAWWNGRGSGEGQSCLMIAVFHDGLGFHERGWEQAQRRLLAAVGAEDYNEATRWNDAPERTKDEVLAAYDCAIAQIT